MKFVDLVYNEIASEHPHIIMSGLIQPMYYYGYLVPGEYSKQPIEATKEFFENNFTFLWLILVIEGYEK